MSRKVVYVRFAPHRGSGLVHGVDEVFLVGGCLFAVVFVVVGIFALLVSLTSEPHWETSYKDGKATMYKTRW